MQHQSVPVGEDSRVDPQDVLGIVGNRRKSGETLRCAQVSPDFRAIPKKSQAHLGITSNNPHIPAHMDGSVENPRRWIFITRETCSAHTFSIFIDQICDAIEQNPLGGHDHERVVMWDNLRVHTSPLVLHTLEGRASRAQFDFTHLNRPPYQPKWAPIEYVFNLISGELNRRVCRDWTPAILEQNIRDIAGQIGRAGGFFRTFLYCGYR